MDNAKKDSAAPYIDGLVNVLQDVAAERACDLPLSDGENQDKPNEETQLAIKRTEAEIERLQNDTKNRSVLAYWTFGIISVWLIFVASLLAFKELPESVFITLLTTTTINIIGLPAIVLHGYFSQKK